MSSIFDFTSYKLYLSNLLIERNAVRGFQSKLAEAAGCQASYLSQVLKTKVELTPDHAMGIGKFLQLTDSELDYFLNLVHHSRATLPALRERLLKKISHTQNDQKNLSRRIMTDSINPQENLFYYSSWIFLATHMAIGISDFQTEESLVRRLGIDRQVLIRTLRLLEQYGLAEFRNGKWLPKKRESHLPADSFMTEVNHSNWRARALLDIQKDPGEWVHYTSAFTMTRKDANILKSLILKFIEDARTLIRSSDEEDVYCLLADFFPV